MAMFTPNRRPPRFESPGEPRVSVTPCKRKWGFSPEEKQHPHGPVRIQEFMSWPTDVIASIAAWDSDALGNLVGVLRRGLAVNSDYSGMDCPREVLTQCFEAVARFKSIDKNEFRLTFSRASDKGQLQKKVLTRIATANDGSCVMGDILERLPKSARKYIAAAAPAKNDPREKKSRLTSTSSSGSSRTAAIASLWTLARRAVSMGPNAWSSRTGPRRPRAVDIRSG